MRHCPPCPPGCGWSPAPSYSAAVSASDNVALPANVEIGGLTKAVPSAGMTSYADDFNVPHDDVPAGTYLRLSGDGSIVVSCRQSTAIRKHWTGWTPGPRRRRSHLRLEAPAFVALQYALAESGSLTRRESDARS